ncbi:hypothetical protein RDABS01_013037 [Bienertia sinuspersici]
MDVLSELFLPIDVDCIKRIPISQRLPDDNIRWIGNSEGTFQVKDAYRFALGNEENATSSTGVDNIWQQLWKLKLPPKVLEFAWRACWEALPHKANLCTKKVLTESSCFRCGATEHTFHVLKDSIDLLDEFHKAGSKPKERHTRSKSKWNPPPREVMKLNFDAAINADYGRVGVGVVARNDQGKVMAAISNTILQEWGAEMVEVPTAKRAVKLAKNQGWRKVIVEGDAANIIKALTCQANMSTYVQMMVEDMLADVSYLDCITFNFCFRECNEVAHRLAKWAVTSFCDEVWLGEGPSWILYVVVSDIASVN